MKLKALHIASFDGNIGDVANHNGFRQSLSKNTDLCVEYTNLEMREFYEIWGKRKFDNDFVNYANEFDLVIFGGGGFFELKWDYSKSGTTIDLDRNDLKKIKTPILFNCLGLTLAKGTSENNIKKFKDFLDYVLSTERCFLTLRNDGSISIIKELYGNDYAKKILRVPDGGFFVEPPKVNHPEMINSACNIAINVASDMADICFTNKDGNSSVEEFIEQFADYCNQILNKYSNSRIVFVPHIFKDYDFISKICANIKDEYVRKKITCSPCLNGTQTNGLVNFDVYRNSHLVVGMRYHSNVCSIGMGIPTIGIVRIDPHLRLYEDINLIHRCVQVNKKGFKKELLEKTYYAFDNIDIFKKENEKVIEKLSVENCEYQQKIESWIKMNKENSEKV